VEIFPMPHHTEKSSTISPHQLASKLLARNCRRTVRITHHMWLPYTPPRKIIQHSLWAEWVRPPGKLKIMNSEV
jgi:hypothetical protein